MATDILGRIGRLAYPSWVALLTSPDEPCAALELHINGCIGEAATPDEVRERVAELLDDEVAWKLFQSVAPAITEEAIKSVLTHAELGADIQLGEGGRAEKWALVWRLARARLPLFLQVLPLLNAELPPVVADAFGHPDIYAVATKLAMATIAGMGLSSHQRTPLSDPALDTLLDICIEGEREHYAYLVPVASALRIVVPHDESLLPNGVMDLEALASEFRTFSANRQARLGEARRSGLAVYPPLIDG